MRTRVMLLSAKKHPILQWLERLRQAYKVMQARNNVHKCEEFMLASEFSTGISLIEYKCCTMHDCRYAIGASQGSSLVPLFFFSFIGH